MTSVFDQGIIPALAPMAKWRLDQKMHRDRTSADGVERRYYTVGALASALGRESVTIRRWISNGVIPDSQYTTPAVIGTLGDAGLRLWSEEQIVIIVMVAYQCGLLAGRPRTIEESRFTQRLSQQWTAKGWPWVRPKKASA